MSIPHLSSSYACTLNKLARYSNNHIITVPLRRQRRPTIKPKTTRAHTQTPYLEIIFHTQKHRKNAFDCIFPLMRRRRSLLLLLRLPFGLILPLPLSLSSLVVHSINDHDHQTPPPLSPPRPENGDAPVVARSVRGWVGAVGGEKHTRLMSV